MNFTFNYRCILPGDADTPTHASFSVAELKTLHTVLMDAIDYADRHENTTYAPQIQLSNRLEHLLSSMEKEEKSNKLVAENQQNGGMRA